MKEQSVTGCRTTWEDDLMPANAGWYEIVEGETHCEHFVVDPFVTEWYFLHYYCRYCCRELGRDCCYLNAGLEFDEHDGSCVIEDWPDSYRYVPPPEDSDNWGFNQERPGVYWSVGQTSWWNTLRGGRASYRAEGAGGEISVSLWMAAGPVKTVG